MSIPAFYLPPNAWEPYPLLDKEACDHIRVLRLKQGDRILLLDGLGNIAHCVLTDIGKKETRAEIIERQFIEKPQSRAILALALSKAVRRDFFMEKAAELGAWEIWLWQARFSQGKLEMANVKSVEGKLIAGLKQSHNPWLPKLRVFSHIGEVAKMAQSANWRMLPWEKQEGVPMLEADLLGRQGETVYVIGPEGGFSESELEELSVAQFTPVSLGGRILRCETAATLCLGLHWWASQLPGHPDFRKLS